MHPVTNWFDMLKADSHIASAFRHGLPANLRSILPSLIDDPEIERLFSKLDTIDANSEYRSDRNGHKSDQFINMMTWKVPFPYAEPCYSPTCHRTFGIYGPVYAHENLN